MEVSGLELLDPGVECIVMMERPSRTLRARTVRIMCMADFKIICQLLLINIIPKT